MMAKIIHQVWQTSLVKEVETGVGQTRKIHLSQNVMCWYFQNGNIFFWANTFISKQNYG